MAHHLNEIYINLATCPPGPYITGAKYKVNGISQGNLGLFSVFTYALNATDLSANVTTELGWPGIIDWADCQLVYVHDNLNNEVAGKNNISNFIWFNPNVAGNRVNSISTVVFNTFVGNMRSNDFFGAFVNLAGANAGWVFSGNHIFNSTVFVNSPLGIDITGLDAHTADVNVTGPGSFRLFNVDLNDSAAIFHNAIGNTNIERSSFVAGHNLTLNGNGNVLIRNTTFGSGASVISPSTSMDVINSAFDTGSGLDVTSIGSVVSQLKLTHSSFLRTAGFNVTNGLIQGVTLTTLTAPVVNGFKTGLVNTIV